MEKTENLKISLKKRNNIYIFRCIYAFFIFFLFSFILSADSGSVQLSSFLQQYKVLNKLPDPKVWDFIPTAAAKIGSEVVSKNDLIDAINKKIQAAEMMGGSSIVREQYKSLAKESLNEIIETILLYDAAKKDGFILTQKDIDESYNNMLSNLQKMLPDKNLKELSSVLNIVGLVKEKDKESFAKSFLIKKWINKAVKSKILISQKQIVQFYEKNKKALYKQQSYVEAEQVSIMPKDIENYSDRLKAAHEILDSLTSGKSLDEALCMFNRKNDLKLAKYETTYYKNNMQYDFEPLIFSFAKKNNGKGSLIFTVKATGTVCIAFIKKYQKSCYYPLDENIQNQIKEKLTGIKLKEKLTKIIDSQKNKMSVIIYLK